MNAFEPLVIKSNEDEKTLVLRGSLKDRSLPDGVTGDQSHQVKERPEVQALVKDLSDLVRRHNTALHRLRRLQPSVENNSDPSVVLRGETVRTGTGADLQHVDQIPDGAFREARAELESATRELRNFLKSPPNSGNTILPSLVADLKQVNGYIISMKISGQHLMGDLGSPSPSPSPSSSSLPQKPTG